jgi:hypothetical protein
MKHIESEKAVSGELITGLFISSNPGVHSEELQIRLVSNKAKDNLVDMRVWLDTIGLGGWNNQRGISNNKAPADWCRGFIMITMR